MKRYIRYRLRHFAAGGLFSFLIYLGGVFVPSPVICQDSVADEIISLNVTAQPLGEVLEDISAAIDCQFSIDGRWENYPITSSFQNQPLHKALKLIFRDLNNAVIYGSERTIKIVIYDKSASSEKGSGHSVIVRPSQEAMPSVSSSQETTAPQPEVQLPDDRSNLSDGEHSQDENAESLSDKEEVGDENEEVQEAESIEGIEERIGDSKRGQQRSEDDEDGNPTEESENTEGNPETNEN